MKRIGLFLLLLLPSMVALQSCSNDSEDKLPEPNTAVQRMHDLTYGPDGRHKLDLYLPEGRDPNTPFIILIHGGAWVSGNKSDMRLLQDSLLGRGIASASINYRYVSEGRHFESLMEDVRLAVDYCYNNRNTWYIRADRYMIGGASAGAHMALLYAYAYDEQQRIGGVVSAAGPADIANAEYLNYTALIGLLDEVENMVGAKYTLFQPLDLRFSLASPLVNVANVPTLMIHGTADLVVPIAHAQSLSAALSARNTPQRLVTLQDKGHDLGVADPNTLTTIINEIDAWCRQYGR